MDVGRGSTLIHLHVFFPFPRKLDLRKDELSSCGKFHH